jgi:flagellar motor component MotA
MNEYEAAYSRPISMYANLLPPVGLTGNAVGMLILMVSKHMAGTPLELGALGLALISTIFALLGYALLEALKLRLYGRMLRCLDEVVHLHRTAEERQGSSGHGSAAPAPA